MTCTERLDIGWDCCIIYGSVSGLFRSLLYAMPFLDYYISEDFQIKNLGKQMIQYQENSLKLVFVGISIYCSVKGRKSKLLSAARTCAALAFICIAFSPKIFRWDWIQQLNPLIERIVSSFLIPTRFLNWGTLFMVPVFGYCLWYAKYESRWKKIAYSIGVAVVLLSVGTSSMYFIYQVTHTYERAQVFDNNLILGYVSGGEHVIYGTDTAGLTYGLPQVSESVQLLEYEKGDLCMATTMSYV